MAELTDKDPKGLLQELFDEPVLNKEEPDVEKKQGRNQRRMARQKSVFKLEQRNVYAI